MSRGVAPGRFDPRDPQSVERTVLALANSLKASTLAVVVTTDTEGTVGANVIRWTFQVTDRQKFPRDGRYRLRVDFATAAFGAPVNTQTVAVVAGTVLVQAIVANQSYELMTDEHGRAQLDVTIAGAGTRHAYASAVELWGSGAKAWT